MGFFLSLVFEDKEVSPSFGVGTLKYLCCLHYVKVFLTKFVKQSLLANNIQNRNSFPRPCILRFDSIYSPRCCTWSDSIFRDSLPPPEGEQRCTVALKSLFISTFLSQNLRPCTRACATSRRGCGITLSIHSRAGVLHFPS